MAHQLLVKIYPNESGLIWAAIQMTAHSSNNERVGNKLYGWLKRKQSKVAKKRTGSKNGSFGKSWYYNPETFENIKCRLEDVPEGYVRGRKMGPDIPNSRCEICGVDTGAKKRKYCIEHRWSHSNFKRPPIWTVDKTRRFSYSGEAEQKRRNKIAEKQKKIIPR